MGLGADAVNKVSKSAESRVRGDGFVSSAIPSLIDEFNKGRQVWNNYSEQLKDDCT
jgi:hypothetical protein